jgi:nitronate monooxygenase
LFPSCRLQSRSIDYKSWTKKYNRVPDAILFEGPLAGGHLGFKEEQLEDAQEHFYETIMEIKEEIEELQDCPLIVAGGIYIKEDVQKAWHMGPMRFSWAQDL